MRNTQYYESFFVDPVTEEEVEKELLSLNPSKLMYKISINYNERHDVLCDKQCGFRKNRSKDGHNELTTKLTDAIDENKLTAGIFLDLSKFLIPLITPL